MADKSAIFDVEFMQIEASTFLWAATHRDELDVYSAHFVRGWDTVTLALLDEERAVKMLVDDLAVPADLAREWEDGHPSFSISLFLDNGIPVVFWRNRPCRRCGETPTVVDDPTAPSWMHDYHDPCIANLPDVEFACCGHANGRAEPYVKVRGEEAARGLQAIARMKLLGGSPPTWRRSKR